MKVYCDSPPELSKAMTRVTNALKVHAPVRGVEFVSNPTDADLVVLHVIGYPETVAAIQQIQERGQDYAIIQYCMRSTQQPHTKDWKEIWQGAELVWSYYALHDLIKQDCETDFSFNFYCSPLGVDPIFAACKLQEVKIYTMLTSGYVAASESVSECTDAIRQIGGRHFHLGPRDAAPLADFWGLNLSDVVLASVYSRSHYVAGLRRAEGFEMPAAEGLCCGARPIMFDAPHYRRWFNDFAEFVPEGSFNETRDAITRVFESGIRPVTLEEKMDAVRRFNWATIVPEFWEGVL